MYAQTINFKNLKILSYIIFVFFVTESLFPFQAEAIFSPVGGFDDYTLQACSDIPISYAETDSGNWEYIIDDYIYKKHIDGLSQSFTVTWLGQQDYEEIEMLSLEANLEIDEDGNIERFQKSTEILLDPSPFREYQTIVMDNIILNQETVNSELDVDTIEDELARIIGGFFMPPDEENIDFSNLEEESVQLQELQEEVLLKFQEATVTITEGTYIDETFFSEPLSDEAKEEIEKKQEKLKEITTLQIENGQIVKVSKSIDGEIVAEIDYIYNTEKELTEISAYLEGENYNARISRDAEGVVNRFETESDSGDKQIIKVIDRGEDYEHIRETVLILGEEVSYEYIVKRGTKLPVVYEEKVSPFKEDSPVESRVLTDKSIAALKNNSLEDLINDGIELVYKVDILDSAETVNKWSFTNRYKISKDSQDEISLSLSSMDVYYDDIYVAAINDTILGEIEDKNDELYEFDSSLIRYFCDKYKDDLELEGPPYDIALSLIGDIIREKLENDEWNWETDVDKLIALNLGYGNQLAGGLLGLRGSAYHLEDDVIIGAPASESGETPLWTRRWDAIFQRRTDYRTFVDPQTGEVSYLPSGAENYSPEYGINHFIEKAEFMDQYIESDKSERRNKEWRNGELVVDEGSWLHFERLWSDSRTYLEDLGRDLSASPDQTEDMNPGLWFLYEVLGFPLRLIGLVGDSGATVTDLEQDAYNILYETLIYKQDEVKSSWSPEEILSAVCMTTQNQYGLAYQGCLDQGLSKDEAHQYAYDRTLEVFSGLQEIYYLQIIQVEGAEDIMPNFRPHGYLEIASDIVTILTPYITGLVGASLKPLSLSDDIVRYGTRSQIWGAYLKELAKPQNWNRIVGKSLMWGGIWGGVGLITSVPGWIRERGINKEDGRRIKLNYAMGFVTGAADAVTSIPDVVMAKFPKPFNRFATNPGGIVTAAMNPSSVAFWVNQGGRVAKTLMGIDKMASVIGLGLGLDFAIKKGLDVAGVETGELTDMGIRMLSILLATRMLPASTTNISLMRQEGNFLKVGSTNVARLDSNGGVIEWLQGTPRGIGGAEWIKNLVDLFKR